MPVSVLPRLEMIADENRVEPDFLGKTREIEQIGRAELLGRGLVSEFQHLSLLQKIHHGDTEGVEFPFAFPAQAGTYFSASRLLPSGSRLSPRIKSVG